MEKESSDLCHSITQTLSHIHIFIGVAPEGRLTSMTPSTILFHILCPLLTDSLTDFGFGYYQTPWFFHCHKQLV